MIPPVFTIMIPLWGEFFRIMIPPQRFPRPCEIIPTSAMEVRDGLQGARHVGSVGGPAASAPRGATAGDFPDDGPLTHDDPAILEGRQETRLAAG
jgi:hypothetical protein